MDVHLRSRLAPDGNFFSLFIIYLSMVTLFSYFVYYLTMVTFTLYFISLFTPLRFVLSEGEGVRIPATSYLVSLFTLIYLVLFHLIPYNLDIPSYLNNRLRYCAAWLERDKHSLHFFAQSFLFPLGKRLLLQ
jgi:hypothetical protein